MIFRNGILVMPSELIRADLETENGVITKIGRLDEAVGEAVDLDGCYLAPGLIDIHTHGGFGGDFMDASEEAFDKALSFHASNGTTSVLATSVTAPVNRICDMLNTVREYKTKKTSGSRVLGAHLEGPYLSAVKKGAQKEEYLRVPAHDSYEFILENKDICRRVTLAPELEGSVEMIERLRENGIFVSGGHDDAEAKYIFPAIEAGMSSCTHWYCAMSAAAMRNMVRSAGLTEIGLIDDRLYLELLADNKHLPPELVKLAYKCKGAEKLCLVSDSLRGAGMPPDGALYSLGFEGDDDSQKFFVSDGVAVMEDKTHYAGSIQPIGKMVKNLVSSCGVSLTEAVRSATLTPAEMIGEEEKLGSLAVGKAADFCVFDKACEVVGTYIGGKKYC